MIAGFLLVAAVAASPIEEARHALQAGRTEQARTMIAAAVAKGASGDAVDRLLADLAYARGDWPAAAAAYRLLLLRTGDDPLLAEKGGLASLRAGEVEEAVALLDRATRTGATWRGWNARGATADLQADWETADRTYAKALELSPDQPAVLNNLGWSRILRGDWQGALDPLEQAARLSPANARIAANLDLARSALSEALPARRPGESGADWAARLNDAGVAAARQGDLARAVAAFAQAVEASDRWFARAANNLAAVEEPKP